MPKEPTPAEESPATEPGPTPAERLSAADAELARATFTARLVRWELLSDLLATAVATRDRVLTYADGLAVSSTPFIDAVKYLGRDVATAYDDLTSAHRAMRGDDIPELPDPVAFQSVGEITPRPVVIGPPAPPNELGRDGALVARLISGLRAASSESEGDRLVVSAEQRATLLVEFVAHFGITIE